MKSLFRSALAVLCALCAGFSLCAVSAAPVSGSLPAVSAEGAVLIDAESGEILYEKNAHVPMGPASTTKLMTALVAVGQMSPETVLTVPREACGIEGSSVYLSEGERLTLKQLLYAMLLSSANDAATAIAIGVGGSVEGFCALMNQTAAQMGLENTHFQNPHGLYDENHYTTAYDLARIGGAVLSHPLLAEIVATYKTTIPKGDDPDARLLINHNKLLRTYEGAIGLKTGFTKKTGRTLVSAARREGLTLIAVTLRDGDDWRDHAAMLDYGFANYESVCFAEAGAFSVNFPVTGGTAEAVALTNTRPLRLTLPKAREEAVYTVTATGHFLFAPLDADRISAELTVTVCGKRITSPLCTASAVPSARRKGFLNE